MDDRGASEVVGVILLTAVVVILMSVVSVAMMTQHAPGAESPRASFRAQVDTTNVTVWHEGAEAVRLDELTVVARGPNETNRTSMATAAASVTGGDGGTPARFEPGERWRWEHGLNVSSGERVEVLVVHEPSNSVLYEGSRIVSG